MKSTLPRLPIDAPPAADWRPPSPQEIYRHPLPLLGPMDRVLTRAVNTLLLPRFTSVTGLEHVGREADPFILALNHSTRFEAVALPALLMYVRGGALVHFMADWNFQMIPGIGLLYRRSGAIVVMRKSARPRFLNALKPIYAPAGRARPIESRPQHRYFSRRHRESRSRAAAEGTTRSSKAVARGGCARRTRRNPHHGRHSTAAAHLARDRRTAGAATDTRPTGFECYRSRVARCHHDRDCPALRKDLRANSTGAPQ
jgi:1-acyl-sn-glycerol-3-phosphate acyltransferase